VEHVILESSDDYKKDDYKKPQQNYFSQRDSSSYNPKSASYKKDRDSEYFGDDKYNADKQEINLKGLKLLIQMKSEGEQLTRLL
jgi:hypothetical protein